MKLIIKTKYIYKNSINNICLTLKCAYFNNYNNAFSVDNMRLNTDNINAIYLQNNGYECCVYESKKNIRATSIEDNGQFNKTITRDKYDKIMEELQQYNYSDDNAKIYSEIYNDKKQKTSTEDNADCVTLQLLEDLYNKYIIKSGYIKQVQYQYNYTDKQKITFIFNNKYRQIFYNVPTKMAFLDINEIKK